MDNVGNSQFVFHRDKPCVERTMICGNTLSRIDHIGISSDRSEAEPTNSEFKFKFKLAENSATNLHATACAGEYFVCG